MLALAALVLAFAFALGACESGESLVGCARDSDCPPGARCVTPSGVCVDFRNPLDAAVPDLAGADRSGAD